jgi:hypothetical protein
MSRTTQAFSRVKIYTLLRGASSRLTDGVNVRFECALPDGAQPDCLL